MKILFINPVLRTAESNTIPPARSIKDCLGFTFCKAMHDLGHEVTLFAASEYKASEPETYPFEIIFAKSWLKRIFTPRVIPFIPGLVKHLWTKGDSYDIIVSSEIHTLHSLIAAILKPRKLIVWHELSFHFNACRQIPSKIWFRFSGPVYSRVKAICPRSARARDFLLRYFGNVANEPIGHGVDLSKFLTNEDSADHFIVCSQLIPRKRVDDTIHRFHKFVEKYPERTESLLIVGEGESKPELVELARSLGVESRVRFLGRMDHSALVPLLSTSKAMLVSSRRDLSLLSISEALACGTPVVCQEEVDSADLIRQHGLGIVSAAWNEDDLHEVATECAKYKKACRERRFAFSNAHLAEQMVKLGTLAHDRGRLQPRVAIISQNCFIQCDLPLLEPLKSEFEIRWRVFFPKKDRVGYTKESTDEAAKKTGIEHKTKILDHRMRSPFVIWEFLQLVSGLAKWKPDVVYVNAIGHPWLGPVLAMVFGRKRVIWALHDVREHGNGFDYQIMSAYKKILYTLFHKFHTLSHNQEAVLRARIPHKTVHYAAHPPLVFGPIGEKASCEKIRFLFFGYVAPHKGVEFLIEAAQKAWSRGVRGFEVLIAGKCDNWAEEYQSRIQFPEVFNLDIRMIPNELVPTLYGSADWLILPYKHLTQSGPMSIGFHYNLPAIVSDLPEFAEFIEENSTALKFTSENSDSLSECIEKAVTMGKTGNQQFRKNLATFVENKFSIDACASQYKSMFLNSIEHN